MATQVQFRRGTKSQNDAFTGALGEITVNTTNDSIHVHDGSTAGGFEGARANLSNHTGVGILTAQGFSGNITGVGATFTTVTSSLTGDVTGDLTGNVTGNVTSTGANTLGSLIVTNHATVGGALTVTGNLTVDGTTTTINSTTLTVDDKTIVIASGAADAAAANGAGISIDGASATLTYSSSGDQWVSNKEFEAPDFNATSDATLKQDISIIDNALEMINQLEGVSWRWKESLKPSLGVTAQNVEKVAPELVKNGDHKSVNYNGLIGVLIEAVKELKAEVDELKR